MKRSHVVDIFWHTVLNCYNIFCVTKWKSCVPIMMTNESSITYMTDSFWTFIKVQIIFVLLLFICFDSCKMEIKLTSHIYKNCIISFSSVILSSIYICIKGKSGETKINEKSKYKFGNYFN